MNGRNTKRQVLVNTVRYGRKKPEENQYVSGYGNGIWKRDRVKYIEVAMVLNGPFYALKEEIVGQGKIRLLITT